jgi:cobalt/nickel transport protein
MKKGSILTAILLSFQILSSPCLAHFGMIIPSDSMVMQGESKTVKLTLSFSHPFEGQGLELDRPREFGVRNNGKKQNLIETLKKTRVMEHSAWAVAYKIKRPGIYFIIHYTKTVVAAFGDDEGWDEEIGLKTEIIPLCKPFGLYAGNVFQGIVKFNGKAVPFAEVEVEYYNMGAKMTAPTAYMIAQTIKADQNGVFTYAAPVAGWWGFAALNPADFKLHHNGKNKDVELGAVIWVKFHDWQSR